MTGLSDFDRIEDHIRILTERIDNINNEDEESYAQKFLLRQMIRFLIRESDLKLEEYLVDKSSEEKVFALFDVSIKYPLIQRMKSLLDEHTSVPLQPAPRDHILSKVS